MPSDVNDWEAVAVGLLDECATLRSQLQKERFVREAVQRELRELQLRDVMSRQGEKV